jgi:hypothetical protein
LHAQALARGPLAAVRLHRTVGSGTARAAVRCRRRRCCQRGRTPAASRRLPGQRQRQAPPTATQPPFGIQAESGVPLGVVHLSGPSGQAPPKSVIPTQRRVTEQLTKNWAPFKALRQHYAGTRFEEQRQLHLPQQHKASVADSALRVEMNTLEEQADNAKASDLYPLSWLGTIRPTSANDAFDPALWETLVSTTLGLGIPVPSSLPRLHNRPITECGCKKHALDLYGDHTSTCTAHSGATKAHDWMVGA